jgi:methyl-accepting chemotaxis protein
MEEIFHMKLKLRLFKWNVRSKLILAFAIILLIPSITIGCISYSTAKTKVDDELERASSANVEVLNGTITQVIEAQMKNVDLLSQEISGGSIGSKQGDEDPNVRKMLDDYKQIHPELELEFVGTDKGVYMHSPSSVVIPPGFDPRVRPWYQKAMENKGNVVITDPYVSQGTNNVVVSIAKVVSDGHGVVSESLSLKALGDIVKGVKIGKQGYVYIVDGNSNILIHPTIVYDEINQILI